MYSREPMDRQREQAVEVLLAMEGQCRELVIDCRQGMLGKQGCQVTVLRREHILSLLQELNRLYDSGIIQTVQFLQEGQDVFTSQHGYLAPLLSQHSLPTIDD